MVYGRGLKKRGSAPPHGPCGLEKTLRFHVVVILKKKHTLLTTSTFNLPFFRHDKNLKFFAFTAYRVYIGHIRIVAENTRLRPKRFFLSQKGLYYSLYFPYFCTNFAIDYRQIIQVLNHLEKWFIQIMHNK